MRPARSRTAQGGSASALRRKDPRKTGCAHFQAALYIDDPLFAQPLAALLHELPPCFATAERTTPRLGASGEVSHVEARQACDRVIELFERLLPLSFERE